jgi:hypothetical protein
MLRADGHHDILPSAASLQVREVNDGCPFLVWHYKSASENLSPPAVIPYKVQRLAHQFLIKDNTVDLEGAWRVGVPRTPQDFRPYLPRWELDVAYRYQKVVCEELRIRILTAERLWSLIENLEDPSRFEFRPEY